MISEDVRVGLCQQEILKLDLSIKCNIQVKLTHYYRISVIQNIYLFRDISCNLKINIIIYI